MPAFHHAYWNGVLALTLLTGTTVLCLPSLAQSTQPPMATANTSTADAALKTGNDMLSVYSYAGAEYHFQQALNLYRTANSSTGQLAALQQLTLTYYRQGYYRQAQQMLLRAQGFYSAATPEQQVRLLLLSGMVELEMGDALEAMVLLRQAQPRLSSLSLADANLLRIGLGKAYRYNGFYGRAMEFLSPVTRASGNRADTAEALAALGDVFYDLGDYEQAFPYYEQALAISYSIGDRLSMGRHLHRLGQIAQQKKEDSHALALYEEALMYATSISHGNTTAQIFNSIGEIQIEQGKLDQAIVAYEEALSTPDVGEPLRSTTLSNVARYYHLEGDFAKALEFYIEAYRESYDINAPVGMISAMGGQAEVLLTTGKLGEAQTILTEAIGMFEALQPGLRDAEKVSFFETQIYLYELLQQTLVAQGKAEEALVVAERGRARAFVESLAVQTAEQEPSVDLAALQNPNLEQMRQLARDQQATIVQYSIIREPSPGRSRFTDKVLYIWVIQPTGDIRFEQLPLNDLNQDLAALVADSRDVLGVRGFSPFLAAANVSPAARRGDLDNPEHPLRQLYDTLIAPISDTLPSDPNAKVVFVPQRALFLVPFAALRSADGQYLIESHTVVSAPSIQVMDLLQKRLGATSGNNLVVGVNRQADDQRQAVIVGNPKMPKVSPALGLPTEALSPLPGAEAEAMAIAPLLQTTPLIGQDATEATVRSRMLNADIIHLATHGLLDDQQGLQSAIVLTAGSDSELDYRTQLDPNDGLLTAQEVLNLDLKAELVVLSACNTGRGRITGDGVAGLSRSFLIAGAENLVASLWAVPDDSTAVLMTHFYQALQTTPDPAHALRQAMLNTLADYPNPRDWASFVMVGGL
jgi:CHAT domain-containing protein/tetratricopeptide (TPR) repeat protein